MSSPRPFWFNITLVLGLITLAAIYVAGEWARINLTSRLEESFQHVVQRDAALLAIAMLESVISEDKPQIETILSQTLASFPAIVSIRVSNEEGLVLADRGDSANVDSENRFRYSRPVAFSGEVFGRIDITLNTAGIKSAIDKQVASLRFNVTWALLLLGLLTIVSVYVLAIQPVQRVTKRLLGLAEGKQPESALDVHESLELARLGESVDSLGEVMRAAELREQQLLEAKSLIGAVFDAVGDAVFTVNTSGGITLINKEVEKLWGFREDQLLGRDIDQLIRNHFDEGAEPDSIGILKTGARTKLNSWVEQQGRHRNGKIFPVEIHVAETLIAKRTFFTVAVRDITERQQVERELKAARDLAEVANQAKSEFLSVVSHEIRTPMSALLGLMDLLAETELTREQGTYITTAQESGQALLTLLNDIVDLSRIEAGKLHLETSNLGVGRILDGIIDLLGSQAQAKGIDLASRIAPEVPAILSGDPGRIRQILVNLVGNAIKFTDTGSVLVEADLVAGTANSSTIMFRVIDTGIGIKTEEQAHLFENFVQVDSSDSRKYEGSGLGLAICKKLVGIMHGEIGLESQPGHGSSFWFSVTLGRVATVLDEHANLLQAVDGLRIMLVGGDTWISTTLSGALSEWNMHTEHIVHGADALIHQRLMADRGAGFDCVLVIDPLTDMSAEELAAGLRRPSAGNRPVLIGVFPLTGKHVSGFDRVHDRPVGQTRLLQDIAELAGQPFPLTATAEREADVSILPTPVRHTGHILIAEDSPANQIAITGRLRKLGYTVDVVNNGRAAVEAVQRTAYGLVLMDVRMPEMNGLDATRAIRSLRGAVSEIAIIAMTANAMTGDRGKCLAAGMNDYLAKPIKRSELAAILEAYAGGCQAIAEPEKLIDAEEPVCGVLDFAVLKELENDISAGALPEMISTFLGELSGRLATLEGAQNSDNLERVAYAAHAIKSGAGTFGATQLQEVASSLEAACRCGDEISARKKMGGMRIASREAISAFGSYIESRYSMHIATDTS